MESQVRIIPAKNIDRLQWDDCVRSSPNGVIYAYSFYMDSMADNWSGIVAGDYNAVMPVPWRKKFAIRYAYDVPFVQQLGWFFKEGCETTVQALAGIFFKFVKYGSYSFNHGNTALSKKVIECNNYIIPLSQPYEAIRANYSGNACGSLKKSARLNISCQPAACEEAIDMYMFTYGGRLANTRKTDYLNFTALCKMLQTRQMAFAKKVVDNSTGNLLSSALFLQDERRIYNIMPCTTGEGRKAGAGHFLIDDTIKEFAGSGLVFDFEGSDIGGIKQFYESFGPVNQPYPRVEQFNHLPFPLGLLKR